MAKTRLYPRDLSFPEPLTDKQIADLKAVLQGFRHLYDLLDDLLPYGDPKKGVSDLLAKAKCAADDVVRYYVPRLTVQRLCDLFADKVERWDKRVTHVVLNAVDFAALRADPDFKGNFDPCNEREGLLRGYMGSMFGAEVFASRNIPEKQIVLLNDPDDKDVEINRDWAPAPSQLLEI